MGLASALGVSPWCLWAPALAWGCWRGAGRRRTAPAPPALARGQGGTVPSPGGSDAVCGPPMPWPTAGRGGVLPAAPFLPGRPVLCCERPFVPCADSWAASLARPRLKGGALGVGSGAGRGGRGPGCRGAALDRSPGTRRGSGGCPRYGQAGRGHRGAPPDRAGAGAAGGSGCRRCGLPGIPRGDFPPECPGRIAALKGPGVAGNPQSIPAGGGGGAAWHGLQVVFGPAWGVLGQHRPWGQPGARAGVCAQAWTLGAGAAPLLRCPMSWRCRSGSSMHVPGARVCAQRAAVCAWCTCVCRMCLLRVHAWHACTPCAPSRA